MVSCILRIWSDLPPHQMFNEKPEMILYAGVVFAITTFRVSITLFYSRKQYLHAHEIIRWSAAQTKKRPYPEEKAGAGQRKGMHRPTINVMRQKEISSKRAEADACTPQFWGI